MVVPLVLLLVIAHSIYKPGLSGGFLLDDQASVSKLAIINDELSFDHLYDYFAASETGLLKRPVSVFSFLLDATNWPAEAYSFKRTNLIIHLINGGLLYLLIWLVVRAHQRYQDHAIWVAFTATALWLLNPFLVSSTLYVVQRMAMLPALFVLLGLLVFFLLRRRLLAHESKPLYLLLWLSVVAATVLAMLSKENGVLYIFLVALFNVYILQGWLGFQPMSRTANWWIIRVPVILLVLAIVLQVPGAIDKYDYREFDLTERLLTQFRALTVYLYHLLIPDYFTEGVYTDGFKTSTRPWQPLSTMFSMLFVIGLLLGGWLLRKPYPWLAFVVFFFFAAHILESSIFPLEMYFEHRNYVPALFMFVPVCLLLSHLVRQTRLYFLVPLVLVALFAMQTQMRVHFWSNNTFLNQQTLSKFPESVRVHTLYAMQYDQSGLPGDALKIIEDASLIHDDLELKINAIMLRCNMKIMDEQRLDEFNQALQNQRFTKDDMLPFDGLIRVMVNGDCDDQWGGDRMLETLEYFARNPVMSTQFGVGLNEYYRAKYHIHKTAEFDQAVEHYMATFATDQDINVLLEAGRDFYSKSAIKQARLMLERAENAYHKQFRYRMDWHKIKAQILQLNQKIESFRSE